MKTPLRLLFLISLLAILSTGAQTTWAQGASPAMSDCSELPALKKRLGENESRLKDWAQLGRYRDANTKVAPPAKNEQRVVFMGDSITDGWSNPAYGGFFPGKPYINRGIGGQTTPQMLIRFRPDVIDLQPKVVVILAGTNDIAGNTGPMTLEQIEENLSTMCELAKAHHIKVVLSSLLPVSDYEKKADGMPIIQTERRPPAKITALNEWIKQYVTSNGYIYLDYYSATVDANGLLKAEISKDGLHPDAKGYAIMGPLAQAAIDAAMKK
jgi:lysophospholipase L1-like esterase